MLKLLSSDRLELGWFGVKVYLESAPVASVAVSDVAIIVCDSDICGFLSGGAVGYDKRICAWGW